MSQANKMKESPTTREQRILNGWRQHDTFRKSVEQRKDHPPFVLYEGPPTANGSPHIGHVLGRVLKDLVCRYKTMRGYRVERRAGWDTHGLPVERGVEKQLGLSGKADIERYGVGPFIEACKASVFRYEQEWRHLTEAIGYWTDLDDPYVTMDPGYMERVWHILAHIHRQGHLYRGHRVSPYCPCCQTTLSSHEVAQGYEDTADWSATVRFRLIDSGDVVLAWTTTPWTLPANTALAVNRHLSYVRVRHGHETVIIAQERAVSVLGEQYEILDCFNGEQLLGQRYVPLFAGIAEQHLALHSSDSYRIVHGDFVTVGSGTGIVHIAPAYGEDDYRLGMNEQLGMLHVLDAAGRFEIDLADCRGKFFKDGESQLLTHLEQAGLLFKKERYTHSYPFCWRCHSPLIYRAMESWFIRTTVVREQMIHANLDVDWHPAHLRDGRFGHFLEELVDWNISRNRYWGTPLNIWQCRTCACEYAPDSLDDLRNRAQAPLDADFDPHKPQIDQVYLDCPSCGGTR